MTTIYRFIWQKSTYGDTVQYTQSKSLATEQIYIDSFEVELPEPSIAEVANLREKFQKLHDIDRLESLLKEAESLKDKLEIDCHV